VSIVTLAPEIEVGLTQSMRVALVRTVRGTREAYRIGGPRRGAAYGVFQTTFPSGPRSTRENTGSCLTTSAPDGLRSPRPISRRLTPSLSIISSTGSSSERTAHGQAAPLVLAEEIERRKRVELRGDVPLESLDTSDEIELTRLRHGHLLVSVVPEHAKGEIREVPEHGESAQGREDAHDIGHVLHPVPKT